MLGKKNLKNIMLGCRMNNKENVFIWSTFSTHLWSSSLPRRAKMPLWLDVGIWESVRCLQVPFARKFSTSFLHLNAKGNSNKKNPLLTAHSAIEPKISIYCQCLRQIFRVVLSPSSKMFVLYKPTENPKHNDYHNFCQISWFSEVSKV